MDAKKYWDGRWRAHDSYRNRQEQGPENQRVKGSRIWCRDTTVGKIKKILKTCSGIKKIHIIDAGIVEIIHTCTKDANINLIRILKDNNIQTGRHSERIWS